MTTPRPKLDRNQAVVVLVDVQERLLPAMPPERLQRLMKYAKAMLQAARELRIPVLAKEQYPKGLGATAPQLRELLPGPPLVKMHFSCGADPAFAAALAATGRKQVIVVGIETHVCVFQTARDLVSMGYEVYVCADATASRSDEHRESGLELIRSAGGVIHNVESAIFDLLHVCGTDEFRKIAPLVR
jgi:nicotinamidase-related amidase